MTNLQKLALRQSEIRKRCNEISGLSDDDFTDKVKEEFEGLKNELNDVEVRYQAALLSDEQPTETKLTESTGEGKEIRKLLQSAKSENYFATAFRNGKLTGAETELNEALECTEVREGGIVIPLEMFDDDLTETRAATSTAAITGPEMQSPILQKLYASPITDALGISQTAISQGSNTWILLTDGGTTPAMKGESADVDTPTAATLSTESLSAEKLICQYEYTAQVQASIPQIVPALRENLMLEMRDQMQNQIINGNGTSPQVSGFMNELTAPADPSEVADYASLLSSLSSMVNGIVATEESEVSFLAGLETYKLSCTLYNTGSGEVASEALKQRGRGYRASSYLPAATSNIQKSNILHAGGMNRTSDSCMGLWPSIELIVDRFTKAGQATTVLTAIQLWNFKAAFRPNAYSRYAVKVA